MRRTMLPTARRVSVMDAGVLRSPSAELVGSGLGIGVLRKVLRRKICAYGSPQPACPAALLLFQRVLAPEYKLIRLF